MTPVPGVERFKPLRAGLVNLFEYGDQAFEFADGHLLLRGHNGAGKSKALELLLPFVLDGDTHSAKLDPFATTARGMKWNLILDGRHESRCGYAWLELGRREPGGGERYLTVAVGLRAHRDQPEVTTWFLIAHDRRIGADLDLIDHRRNEPHRRRGIVDALGDGVEVFDVAGEYRERLNQLAFGFPSVERYQTMLELQRQLRRPQLSKSLDPEQLSEILTESLPEVDARLIADIGAHLDAIEQLRRDLRALTAVREGFEVFVATYRTYARAVVRERADGVLAADREAERARSELDAKRTAAAAAERSLSELAERLSGLRAELERARGSERELLSSDAVRSAGELRELRERVEHLGAGLERIAEQLVGAREEAGGERREQERLRAAGADAGRAVDGVAADLAGLALTAGLDHHEALAEELRAAGRPQALAKTMSDGARERRGHIAEQRGLRGAAERERANAGALEGAADGAEGRVRGAEQRQAACEDQLDAERTGLAEAVGEWMDGLRTLALPAGGRERLLDLAAAAGDDRAEPLRRALDDAVGAHEAHIVRGELALESTRSELAREREPLEAERRALEDRRDPVPERAYTRTADRSESPGAPLWRLVDFAEGLPEDERAGLEGALEGAGLLDAWVLPDGRLLDVDGELLLAPGPAAAGRRLGEALVPVAGVGGAGPEEASGGGGPAGAAQVESAVVDAILDAIGLDQTAGGTGVRVGLDGSFRLGPARGRYAKPAAQFIGVAAREANRARRLTHLTELLDALAGREAALDERHAELAHEREALAAELEALPPEDGARAAFRAVRDLERQLTSLRAAAAEARAAADEAAERAASAARAATDHARAIGLPTAGAQPALEALEAALDDYVGRVGELAQMCSRARDLAERAEDAARRAIRVEGRIDRLETDEYEAASELERRRGALDVLDAEQGEAARDALRRLAEVQERIGRLEAGERETAQAKEREVAARARLTAEIESAQAVAAARESSLAERLDGFRALEPHDFLRLAAGHQAAVEPRAEGSEPEEVASWDAARVRSFLRESAEALGPGADVEALTNRVDRQYIELQGSLDGSVGLRPFITRKDGLALVGVTRGGRQQPVRVLLESLEEEIEAQRRSLTERDQETFERFLFNGIAQHLRGRIAGARQLVEETNAAIAGCQTSSGVGVELRWESLADDDPLLRRALGLLRSAPEALSDGERSELIAFFRDRVEAARISEEGGSAAEHLLGALDYRRWHRFRVLQTRDGVKVPLTKRQHESGSGGEKAAALHLPLFAAAAAHMGSAAPHAPRIVMLDEAFAGIDGRMRAQLLGLIEEFDLDFMLTSHELWCCERELRHLSIYQLHREDGAPGVATVRFLWDGAAGSRREVEDDGAEPPALAA